MEQQKPFEESADSGSGAEIPIDAQGSAASIDGSLTAVTAEHEDNAEPEVLKLHVSTPEEVIALVPHVLGFHPTESLVVLGIGPTSSRLLMTYRYDLPDDASMRSAVAGHALATAKQSGVESVLLIGYGEGPQVTPVVDALRDVASGEQVTIRDALRVTGNRYWSYLCEDPACCPPEGAVVSARSRAAIGEVMQRTGRVVRADRSELADSVQPSRPDALDAALRVVADEFKALTLASESPGSALIEVGRKQVQSAIYKARAGQLLADLEVARLVVTLQNLAVRDDAWARMDPAFKDEHLRLWQDVMSRTPDQFTAAPGALLAFVAWQAGDGALANVALDRVQATNPDYSMATLLRDCLQRALPPSLAVLPMTPEEVAKSYLTQESKARPYPPDKQT